MGGVFTKVRTNFIRGDMPSQLYSIPGMQALVPLIDNAQRRELDVALRNYNVDTNPDTIINYINNFTYPLRGFKILTSIPPNP